MTGKIVKYKVVGWNRARNGTPMEFFFSTLGEAKAFLVKIAKLGWESAQIEKLTSPMLCCTNCGLTWHPMLGSGGRMPRGYRNCPNGC